MRAYSQDLRDRVISKYNTGEYQIKQLASMYQMSRQTIGEWVKRYKATGDYGSRQHLSKGRKIIFNDRKKVLEYLDKNPNSDGITIRDIPNSSQTIDFIRSKLSLILLCMLSAIIGHVSLKKLLIFSLNSLPVLKN